MNRRLALKVVLASALAPALAYADGRQRPPRGTVTPQAGPGGVAQPAANDTGPAPFGQTGAITLADGAVKLDVPAGYYFLPAPEALAHLRRINATVPAGNVLGMIAPAGLRPIDDGFWGAVVSHNPIGYVAAERADRFAQSDFVQEVRDARPTTQPRLESFAVAPAFDGTRFGAAWAEQFGAKTAGARNLRHEQRLLGRSGVAGLTIDAKPEQLAAVTAAAPTMFRMLSFAPGRAYRDYVAAQDGLPQFDLPSLLTNKPRVLPAAAPGAPKTATPAAPPAGPTGTVQTEGQAAPNPVATLVSQPWFPWAAASLVGLAILPWLFRKRRQDAEYEIVETRTVDSDGGDDKKPAGDPNLQPKN